MAQASLDTVQIHRLTLSFSDAPIEGDFRRQHAADSVRWMRIFFGVLLVFIVVGGPLFYFDPFHSLDTWAPYLDEFWRQARVSGLIFLGIVLAGLALSFVDDATDYQQLWAGLYMVIYTPLPLYGAEVMPIDFQRHLYPMMIIHVVNIHLLIRLRFVNATFVAVIVTAFYVAYAGARFSLSAEELRAQMTNLFLANLFGAVGSYQVEMFGRRAFLQSRQLAEAQKKSDALLLNVLPPPIAERLKAGEEPIADGIDDATILFADIVGFTELSDRHEPDEVVDMLNELFVAFDAITEKHGLEKIKTIGDAYMVAGGLFDQANHAQLVADMALDMMHFTNRMREAGNTTLHIRVGINSGPVVAGVIGTRKFAYDLWGDAVNTAARMESHGMVDAIHVSAATRERLGDDYVFESRGTLNVKGKGEMSTYLLLSRRDDEEQSAEA